MIQPVRLERARLLWLSCHGPFDAECTDPLWLQSQWMADGHGRKKLSDLISNLELYPFDFLP